MEAAARSPHPHMKAMNRPSTVERAYQLASSGECAGVSDVKLRLKNEGFPDVAGQLYGPTMAAALRRLCSQARTQEVV